MLIIAIVPLVATVQLLYSFVVVVFVVVVLQGQVSVLNMVINGD